MNRMSGKSLLILELSILLVFFLFAAASCAYMFVKSDNISDSAEALDAAVVKTTSIAESLKATRGDLKKTGNRMAGIGNYDLYETQLVVFFDEDMEPTIKTDRIFSATVDKSTDSRCCVYHISIERCDDDEEIYALDFKTVLGGGAAR